MKNKKLAIFTLVFGILLIVAGLSLGIYNYTADKNEETKKIEDNILTQYETFKENTETFNDIRSTYYNDVAKDLYPESVEDEYDNWISVLGSYTEAIDKVEASSDKLKEECVNKFHSNDNVKNKCESFVIAYETVLNYYTKDIISFNETINLYLKNLDKEQEKIQTYELKYDYMDINLDGKFIGKD